MPGWLAFGLGVQGAIGRGSDASETGSGGEAAWVVLVPGLARTPRCMRRMGRALEEAGYRVRILDYPSRSAPVETLAETYLAPALEGCREEGAETIHVVAHSLGGILLRQLVADRPVPDLGRVVMLGPPNQGSEVVDKLGDRWWFRAINGPAGSQLGTGSEDLPARLPPPGQQFGVLAGTRSINWILSMLIPGPDDGKVAVERTRLHASHEFRAIPSAHPFLMTDRRAIRETLHFLAHGEFTDVSEHRSSRRALPRVNVRRGSARRSPTVRAGAGP